MIIYDIKSQFKKNQWTKKLGNKGTIENLDQLSKF